MKTIQAGILTALIILILNIHVEAQYIIKEADTQFELFNYQKAIDLYEKAYQKKATLHAAVCLANAYHLTGNYQKSEKWYVTVTAMPGSKAEYILDYAKALQSNYKYKEARTQYEKYVALNPDISTDQQKIWFSSCDSAQYWIKNPVLFTLVNERALNTTAADWAAVNYKNGIVFTSDRQSPANLKASPSRPFLKFDGTKLPDPKNYGWTGNNYLRLYEKSDPADSIKLFPVNAGTNYHVGAASFTTDGNTLYFTLTRIPQKITRKKGHLSTINTEIYNSSKDTSGNWGKPVPFKYNNINEWSTGDPFISEDGKTLYFASDMPGGKGGMDIYSCTKKSDDNWTDAVNITAINTNRNERSPFITANGDFYFSSDGRIGMGGLDIYTLPGMKKTSVPRNMGYPVNSPQDDFAFNLGKENTGFLSSNRPGGAGSDDIYSFTIKKILKLILEGKVYDRKTNLPIEGALITLNKKGGKAVTVITGETGIFSYDIDPGADFNLRAQKTNYTVDEASLSTMNLTHSTTLHQDLFLETILLNKVITIRNIYYDFDQSNIRPDAAIELDKLVSTMKTNETVSITLSSYTDSRGKDQYNQWLSQKRANSAVQYIISKGIDKSRIIARGYGKTHLLNHCSNGIKCSEEMHQLNRRTEFKIIKE